VDLSTQVESEKFRTILREARLSCIAVSNDGKSVAVGDDFGKIYHVLMDKKKLIVQTLHWHAHAVQSLSFTEENGAPYLMSGGLEAVLV
jgi:NET1-associated nuclear protein 1 (U3 small nucleolar RNA-associated protein 17)